MRGKNRGFIDVSRAARARRNLSLLGDYLDRLSEEVSDNDLLKSRLTALSRLDQGLGDLVRIVRGFLGTERRGGRGRPAARASQAGAAHSTTNEEK